MAKGTRGGTRGGIASAAAARSFLNGNNGGAMTVLQNAGYTKTMAKEFVDRGRETMKSATNKYTFNGTLGSEYSPAERSAVYLRDAAFYMSHAKNEYGMLQRARTSSSKQQHAQNYVSAMSNAHGLIAGAKRESNAFSNSFIQNLFNTTNAKDPWDDSARNLINQHIGK